MFCHHTKSDCYCYTSYEHLYMLNRNQVLQNNSNLFVDILHIKRNASSHHYNTMGGRNKMHYRRLYIASCIRYTANLSFFVPNKCHIYHCMSLLSSNNRDLFHTQPHIVLRLSSTHKPSYLPRTKRVAVLVNNSLPVLLQLHSQTIGM